MKSQKEQVYQCSSFPFLLLCFRIRNCLTILYCAFVFLQCICRLISFMQGLVSNGAWKGMKMNLQKCYFLSIILSAGTDLNTLFDVISSNDWDLWIGSRKPILNERNNQIHVILNFWQYSLEKFFIKNKENVQIVGYFLSYTEIKWCCSKWLLIV